MKEAETKISAIQTHVAVTPTMEYILVDRQGKRGRKHEKEGKTNKGIGDIDTGKQMPTEA